MAITLPFRFIKDAREELQELKLDLDYDAAKQAGRAGLVFAKMWVYLKL